MQTPYKANLLLKTLGYWLVFLAMYGLYRFFPVFPLSIISGTTESNFQHYKAAFFAYLIISVVEYLLYRKRITNSEAFFYSRLQAAVFVPWLTFLVWYIAPATVGQLPIPLEIAWANLSVIMIGFSIVIFERGWETADISRAQKRLVWAFVLLSFGLYMRFTFGPLPWADVFVEPAWR